MGKKAIEKKKIIYKRAGDHAKMYLNENNELVELRKKAVAEGKYFVEPEEKLIFIIRIRGINRLAPKTRKILDILRLRQIHNGVFMKVNKPMMNMIRLIEPYVTYGYPSLETVRQLIYKRGAARINKQRIPLTDNNMIEEHLKSSNIICIEDLVHEIYTVGPNFKQANSFLWPFKLSSPKGGFDKKRKHFIEDGDYGNRGKAINALVRRMN